MTIQQFLQDLELDAYVQLFEKNDLEFRDLKTLTDDDLRAIGIASLGHRKRILGAIDPGSRWQGLLKTFSVHDHLNTGTVGRALLVLALLFLVKCLLGVSVEKVEVGNEHTCALLSNGDLSCWGGNRFGELVPPDEKFSELHSGGVCGTTTDGQVICWAGAKLGPEDGNQFTSVSYRGRKACGVNEQGGLTCWGKWTNSGTFGSFAETRMQTAGPYKSIAIGAWNYCAIDLDDKAHCWGRISSGVNSAPNQRLKEVSVGWGYACGITLDDQLVCWGGNEDLGRVVAPPKGTFTAVYIGGTDGCALSEDGKAVCWGKAPSAPDEKFSQLSFHKSHACGLTRSGDVLCWGSNGSGMATPPNDL